MPRLPVLLTVAMLAVATVTTATAEGLAGDPPTASRAAPSDPWSSDRAETTRLGSDDATATAITISRARFNDDAAEHVVLTRDDDFPDALAGTPLVGDGPMLVTNKDALDPSVRAELDRVLADSGRVYVLGGVNAMSQAIEDDLTGAGYDVHRLAGASRFDTAIAIAEEVTALYPANAGQVLIARARGTADNPTAGFADSVTGGGYAAEARVAVVLSESGGLNPETADYIQGRQQAYLLGGQAALSDSVATAVDARVDAVARVSGAGRDATAVAIATDLWGARPGVGRFTVINGYSSTGFLFGLPAAGLAADFDAPLLVVAADVVPGATADALSSNGDKTLRTLVVGGTGTINESVRAAIEARDGCDGCSPNDRAPLAGATLDVVGAFAGEEAAVLDRIFDQYYEDPTGADLTYTVVADPVGAAGTRAAAGEPTDVAILPSPRAILEAAGRGELVSLEDLGYDPGAFATAYGAPLMDLVDYEGEHYGVPARVSLKSLIWFNAQVFDDQGYTIPATWDELLALSRQMADAGFTPWCIGTESGGATGWPATDWIEDILLRTAGPDVYDAWVAHDIPFTDPRVQAAAEQFAEIAFDETLVLGTTAGIPDFNFGDAIRGIVEPSTEAPSCLMHRQASFAGNFLGEDALDQGIVDTFAFPSIDSDGTLVAGDYLVFYADDDRVTEFIDRFTLSTAQCALVGLRDINWLSPNTYMSSACYRTPMAASWSDMVLSSLRAGTARYDASDLMPLAVGAGTFWSGMNDWMRGTALADVLQEIEDSWPA